MDSRTADDNTRKYPLGVLLTEGKTKQIYEVKSKPPFVLVVSKDDITAGDGAKHDRLKNKAIWSTTTTCNVFELLKRYGVPLAYLERDNENSFVARKCTMLPYEVVVRREAHGSYLQRNPESKKGDRFETPIVELYLKTKGRKWKGNSLTCDDPYIQFGMDGEIRLHDPHAPLAAPFLEMHESLVFTQADEHDLLADMERIALDIFLILEEAWNAQDGNLVDFKLEFGIDADGNLLLADVVDNDSWRVVMDDRYIDKQVYRDGGELDEVAARYEQVAQITSHFLEPT